MVENAFIYTTGPSTKGNLARLTQRTHPHPMYWLRATIRKQTGKERQDSPGCQGQCEIGTLEMSEVILV